MAELTLPIMLAFVALGLGFVIHMIGFCAPHWHDHEYEGRQQLRHYSSPRAQQLYHIQINYGIWRFCVAMEPVHRRADYRDDYRQDYGRGGAPSSWCVNMVNTSKGYDYVRAAQFFETVGFLAAVAAILLLLLGVCITSCRDKRILPILSAICAVAAAACIILGCIIFGAKDAEKPHLSWAFALAIVGGIFHGLAGVLIFLATLLKR